MNIIKWVPEDEMMTTWGRWVQKDEGGSAPVRESREEAPEPDEPVQAEKS